MPQRTFIAHSYYSPYKSGTSYINRRYFGTIKKPQVGETVASKIGAFPSEPYEGNAEGGATERNGFLVVQFEPPRARTLYIIQGLLIAYPRLRLFAAPTVGANEKFTYGFEFGWGAVLNVNGALNYVEGASSFVSKTFTNAEAADASVNSVSRFAQLQQGIEIESGVTWQLEIFAYYQVTEVNDPAGTREFQIQLNAEGGTEAHGQVQANAMVEQQGPTGATRNS